jgi:membrane protease YdiL (CAAX protease family)
VVPLALIVLAAAVPIARPFVLAVLVGGVAVAIRRDAPVRWAWAAPIPVAVSLCWALLPVPPVSPSGADCASITSPTAVWRAAEAGVVIGTLAVLGWALRVRPADLRRDLLLRMPARWVVRWSIVLFLVAGPIALVVGPILARPFFGEITYDVTMVGAIAPALLFAVANGSMEELVYRGALLGWSARVIGVPAAVVGQALVFGVAHSGADVTGSPLVLMAALGLGGLIAGVIAVRTRSLLLPMAVHIGLDIPIYYAFACATA